MNIYKKIQGTGDQNIVVIHGWPCEHRYVAPISEHLAKHYRVFSYDLPGMGQSDWDDKINSVNDMADALLNDLPPQAIYVGSSFGGMISTSIAARYPERVKHYIGVGTSPKFIASADWEGFDPTGFTPAFADLKNVGFKNCLDDFIEQEFIELATKPSAYHHLKQLLASTQYNPAAVVKGVDLCDQTDLRAELKSLECPIDLIFGGLDACVPVSSSKKIQALNSRINVHIMAQAHHMPFWTHQQEFFQLLDDILGK